MRCIAYALIGLCSIATARAGTVVVTMEGADTTSGVLNAALCDKGLSEEGCPIAQHRAAATGKVEFRFENVQPGRYAVVGFHDVNGNRKFDRLLGMPQEPYALSNNVAENLLPKFSDAAVTVGDGETRVTLRLRRFMGK
jgi:uncharacterized protein (DUF2141 family)